MGRRITAGVTAAALTCSGLALLAPAAGAATYEVTSVADDGSEGTFRWAVAQAGANPGDDVVDVDPAVTAITLDDCTAGRVEISPTNLLTVNGNGATITQTCADHGVLGGVGDTTLNDLTLTGGDTTGDGGAISLNGGLTLNGVTVTANRADGDGGGILTVGATITDSVIADNRAGGQGGGIHLVGGGELTLLRTTVEGNEAVGDGGGLRVEGSAVLRAVDLRQNATDGDGGGGLVDGGVLVGLSTIEGNEAGGAIGGIGGALVEVYETTVTDNAAAETIGGVGGDRIIIKGSAVTRNRAPLAGGVGAVSHVEIKSATIAENVGGGIDSAGPVELTFATVVGNQGTNISAVGGGSSFASVIALGSTADCSFPAGAMTWSTYNFAGDATCGFAGTGDTNGGGDPMLAPLALNDGVTENLLPVSGSPLLNKVPDLTGACSIPARPITIPNYWTLDQRLFSRVANGSCDIGAVEVRQVSATPLSVSTPFQTPIVTDLVPLVTDPDGVLAVYEVEGAANGSLDAAEGGLVTYTPNPGFSGTDSYTFVVCSVGDVICTAGQTITVAVGAGATAATPVAATPTFAG